MATRPVSKDKPKEKLKAILITIISEVLEGLRIQGGSKQDTMQRLLVLFSILVVSTARAEQLVAFDAAHATSTYSAGNLAGSPVFAAQQALSGGSGYWQSISLVYMYVILNWCAACFCC